VRGYSQLIIIKTLMDEVARLELNTPDENGNAFESSFHPFSPNDGKSVMRPPLERRRKRKKTGKEASTIGHRNRNTGKSNEQGKYIEKD
jgi:hypothetical protein